MPSERAAVQHLFISPEFNVWLYHPETPQPPTPAANAVGGQQLPSPVLPQPMLCAEGGGREGCSPLLFNNLALLKYHSMWGKAFVLGGELCCVFLEWFCTEWYVMGKGRFLCAVPRRAST